jgi:CHAD domain-containing protein
MHAFLEADMGDKPALRPQAAIGPAVRAIAIHILGTARAAITDQRRTSQDAVHDFRRAMKDWRALMRLLEPFVPEAGRLRIEARDHARSLGQARDGQAALNAFDFLLKSGVVISERTTATIRSRLIALRGSEEKAVLTADLRDAIIAWLDETAAAIDMWPLEPFDFAAIAAQLAVGYRASRRYLPDEWQAATPAELHGLRRRVVDHRYQMELVEPLWPRFGRMWIGEAERLRDRLGKIQDLAVLERLAGPHQPLAHWRTRLAPACTELSAALSLRAARIARRLFAERPRAFRRRLEALWDQGQ